MSDEQLNGALEKLIIKSDVKLVVVERSSKSSAPTVQGVQANVVKNYGDTAVYFFVRDDAR